MRATTPTNPVTLNLFQDPLPISDIPIWLGG